MNVNTSVAKPPVSPEEVEAAAAEVCRLEPGYSEARARAAQHAQQALSIHARIKRYEFRLKFRGIQNTYEFWPIGVMIVPAFAVGGLLFILGLAFEHGVIVPILTIGFGVSITAYVCFSLLWLPPTEEIRRQLPRLRSHLPAAQMRSQNSTARLQAVEEPYLKAKQRHKQLKRALAEYERRQRRLEIQRQREAARREREAKRTTGGEYIYVLVNSSMPGLCKIGKTTRDPESRATELSSDTGVPTPFVVAWEEEVSDCSAAEREIHRRLAGSRESDNREFFRVDSRMAIEVVQDVCRSMR